MKLLSIFFIVLLGGSCGEKNSNLVDTSPKNNQREHESPFCIKEFVDGVSLGAPSVFPDEMTRNALAQVKKSPKTLKLAIGVSNTNREVQRFKKECEDWIFLDIFGVANGPAFFHIDLSDLKSLTKLADEMKDTFSHIAIDYSVTRLVTDFSFAHIFQIMRMLKNNGSLNLWYDESPFRNTKETKDIAQFDTVIAEVKRTIDILDRAAKSPNLNEGFFTVLQNYHSHNYSFLPKLSAANAKKLEDLVNEHGEKKTAVLKKLFLLKNIQFELKENGIPLPVGDFDYTKLPYLALTKLK